MLSVLFVLGVMMTNTALTSNSYAMYEEKWHVTCNYDAEGNFTGGSCVSLGLDECYCPSSIFGEN